MGESHIKPLPLISTSVGIILLASLVPVVENLGYGKAEDGCLRFGPHCLRTENPLGFYTGP